jgi:hypothetical protein
VPEFKGLIEQLGLMNEPIFIRAMQAVGAASADDSIRGSGGGSSFSKTPDEAKAEIAKMEGDKAGPLWNRGHPEHELAVKRRTDLYKMAYPEQGQGQPTITA